MVQGSVTGWIARINSDRELATDQLWRRFHDRLTRLARWALGDAPRVLGDEEDIAAIAFAEVMRGSEREPTPDIASRDELWRLLSCTVVRRARDYRRRAEVRQSRRRVADSCYEANGLTSTQPSPESVAELADWLNVFIQRLDEDRLRKTALMKLEGYSTHEIAQRMGCIERTVDRRLAVIRRRWNALAHEATRAR